MSNKIKTYEDVVDRVARMANEPEPLRLAELYDLQIEPICWEDVSRTPNSVLGPCISDITLEVDRILMPIIRNPNFSDLTWDVPIEKIRLVVGNELAENFLCSVSLKTYLSSLYDYLPNPADWHGERHSLMAHRDTHVLMSAQGCFLPIPKTGEALFNISLYNYESTCENPSILAIVATNHGTSAQVINQNTPEKLYFNKNGNKCPFTAVRLTDDRISRGVEVTREMNTAEKQQNIMLIIQVPLKQPPKNFHTPMPICFNENVCLEGASFPRLKMQPTMNRFDDEEQQTCNIESAIIKVGEEQGKHPGLKGIPISRDSNYPIRVTVQFYQSTDNGIIDDKAMQNIASLLTQAQANAVHIGSLVVGDNSSRPTAYHPSTPISLPQWQPF